MLANIFELILNLFQKITDVFKFILLFIILFIGSITIPNPPKPAITYGEFPISIEYELNGEYKYIEDVVICEFDGFEVSGSSKAEKWEKRLKSGNESITLLQIDENTQIYYKTFSADYYMNEFNYSTQEEFSDNLILLKLTPRNQYTPYEISPISHEVAEKRYNLKILSVTYSKPIRQGTV